MATAIRTSISTNLSDSSTYKVAYSHDDTMTPYVSRAGDTAVNLTTYPAV